MSILKKVGNLFFETDEKVVTKKPAPVSVSKPPQTITIQNAITPTATYVDNDEVTAFREQFKKILDDENKRNFPGNDYYEFVVMKNAMNAIPQESVRYQAAFAGWMTGGNQTKDALISTARTYLGLVDREIKEFQDAYQSQYNEKVLKNEQLINQKVSEVQKYAELIATLNNEIGILKQSNIDSAAKLQSKHDAFMTAGQAQRQEILTEIDKINQYV